MSMLTRGLADESIVCDQEDVGEPTKKELDTIIK